MNIKKLLVLGGTGAIGSHLVALLKSSECQVIVTSRKERLSQGNITYVKGNAHDLNFLKSLLLDHYWAIVNFMTYTTEEFENILPLLLDATDQYFLLSSCRTYADSEELITEDSPQLLNVCKDVEYLTTDNYALAKARQERILKLSGRTNWTIVRPYLTYSEQRLQLGFYEHNVWLLRALMGKRIVFSEDIANKYTTLTYGEDVANVIQRLIGEKEAYGEDFNITCAHSMKWSEILSIYLDELEKFLHKKVDVKMLKKARVSDFPAEKWTYQYDRIFNRCFSNAKLLSTIGDVKFTEPEVGLRHCIREFVKTPPQNGFSWIHQAKLDRITGEWGHLNDFATIKEYLVYLKYRMLKLD